MKLKHLVLDHKHLLVWCRASFCGQYIISSSWEWQIQVLHSSQRDFEPFLLQNSGQVTTWCWWRKTFPDSLLQNTIKCLNIQIWWLCRPWEMFNFTFMFIKPLCHQSCCVYWCIIILIHGTTFRVQCLNHWVHMALQNGSVVLGPSSTSIGPRECHDIAAQTITDPPSCFTLGMQQSGC